MGFNCPDLLATLLEKKRLQQQETGRQRGGHVALWLARFAVNHSCQLRSTSQRRTAASQFLTTMIFKAVAARLQL